MLTSSSPFRLQFWRLACHVQHRLKGGLRAYVFAPAKAPWKALRPKRSKCIRRRAFSPLWAGAACAPLANMRAHLFAPCTPRQERSPTRAHTGHVRLAEVGMPFVTFEEARKGNTPPRPGRAHLSFRARGQRQQSLTTPPEEWLNVRQKKDNPFPWMQPMLRAKPRRAMACASFHVRPAGLGGFETKLQPETERGLIILRNAGWG